MCACVLLNRVSVARSRMVSLFAWLGMNPRLTSRCIRSTPSRLVFRPPGLRALVSATVLVCVVPISDGSLLKDACTGLQMVIVVGSMCRLSLAVPTQMVDCMFLLSSMCNIVHGADRAMYAASHLASALQLLLLPVDSSIHHSSNDFTRLCLRRHLGGSLLPVVAEVCGVALVRVLSLSEELWRAETGEYSMCSTVTPGKQT